MSPEDFEKRLAVEITAAIQRHNAAVMKGDHGATFRATVAPIVRRLVDAEERAALAPAMIAPYVHGDPRVDRWQIAKTGDLDPPSVPVGMGYEPLAQWCFAAASDDGWIVWERPLRAVEVPR